MHFKRLELWNPGVLEGRVPSRIFQTLKERCLAPNYMTERYNQNLVAFIKDEFLYPHKEHPELCDFLIEMYENWRIEFDVTLNDNDRPIVSDIWVNYQRKGEWNPNHNHGGAMSFVIWVQIPYDINEELNIDYYTKKSDRLRKAAFEFTYPTYTNGTTFKTMWINKEDEGRILMFPSKMIHCVYPFTTCDGVRISAAGNLDISKWMV